MTKLLKIQISKKTAALMLSTHAVVLALLVTFIYHWLQVDVVSSRVESRDQSLQVVQIHTTDAHGCSGFRVGPRSVVTAAHCFSTSDPSWASVLFSPLRTDDGVYSGPMCTAIKVDSIIDLDTEDPKFTDDFALVTLDDCALQTESPESYYSLAAFTSAEQLSALNYPGDLPPSTLVTSTGHQVSSWATFPLKKPQGVVPTNLHASPGSSGGVVFDPRSPDVAVGISTRAGGDNSAWVLTLDEERLNTLRTWITENDPESTNAF